MNFKLCVLNITFGEGITNIFFVVYTKIDRNFEKSYQLRTVGTKTQLTGTLYTSFKITNMWFELLRSSMAWWHFYIAIDLFENDSFAS